MTLGELRKLAETNPDEAVWGDAVDRRLRLHQAAMSFTKDEWHKATQYAIDGFGSLQEYYGSDNVEILEFYGDYHDAHTGELTTNRMITVVDRAVMIRNIEIPTYGGKAAIRHVGWRKRGENQWAMGPLDNLIGMQYMIDHYTNMAANALDLKVMPPKKVIGDVEAFVWGPNEIIHLDENGDVQEMAQQFGDVYAALQFVDTLENKMELYAGAPREAMGIRTPGEKTAFEVQSLENAAGRIFQEKIIQFEIFMEALLNDMLEVAHRNFQLTDIIRVIDDDLGVQQFEEVTKEDITADGILRPVGARHFAQKAQELQNLIGVMNSPIANLIAPHISGVAMTDFINDVVDLRGYDIFRKNAALEEAQEFEALKAQAQEDTLMQGSVSEEEVMQQFAQQPREEPAQ